MCSEILLLITYLSVSSFNFRDQHKLDGLVPGIHLFAVFKTQSSSLTLSGLDIAWTLHMSKSIKLFRLQALTNETDIYIATKVNTPAKHYPAFCKN